MNESTKQRGKGEAFQIDGTACAKVLGQKGVSLSEEQKGRPVWLEPEGGVLSEMGLGGWQGLDTQGPVRGVLFVPQWC